MSQLEMDYSAEIEAAPSATVGEVQAIVRILQAEGGKWMKASAIARKLGWKQDENRKRKVRAIARAARPGIVSYPSSPGYKLLADCTLDEINIAVSAWDVVIRDATGSKLLMLQALHSRTVGVVGTPSAV